MTLEQLRTFLAVIEHAGFARAARALGVRQSTVSFHVSALERSVGTPVLDRVGGSVRLTPAGRIVRRYAIRILALRDEALARLRAEESGETGRVTIVASTIPGEYLLPPLLARFRRLHPGVALAVDVRDSSRALAALLADECDLAVVGARHKDRRLRFAEFAHDAILLVGPAPNPFAPGGRLTRARLLAAPLILRESGSGTQEAVDRALGIPVTGGGPTASLRVGSSEAVKRSVRAGLGLGFVSHHAVADDLASGRLTRVHAPGLPIRRRFYVVRLAQRTLPSAARVLLQVMLRKNRSR